MITGWDDTRSGRGDEAVAGVAIAVGGSSVRLFPEGKVEEIRGWNRRCDDILSYGRRRLVEGLGTNPNARLK